MDFSAVQDALQEHMLQIVYLTSITEKLKICYATQPILINPNCLICTEKNNAGVLTRKWWLHKLTTKLQNQYVVIYLCILKYNSREKNAS